MIIKRLYTLIIFFILICFWSFFFWSFKFYMWGSLGDSVKLDLNDIASFLALWSSLAYVIWWAISYSFREKHVLFYSSLAILLFLLTYIYGDINTLLLVTIIITVIWFFYGIWTVVKNVLIAIEIKKTGIQDTTINAIASILFIIFLIFWCVSWAWFFEHFNIIWIRYIFWIMLISWIIALFLTYDEKKWLEHMELIDYMIDRHSKLKDSFKAYYPNVKFLLKKYFIVMFSSGLLWAISTTISQKAIEFSVRTFDKLNSEAWFLLMYSAIWAILWNLITMRMEKKRWFWFILFTYAFAWFVVIFPFLVVHGYFMVILLAIVLWVLFWASSNLIDAYIFHKIWEDDKKEYWSSVYWFILSIVIFWLMQAVNLIEKTMGFNYIFYSSAIVILLIIVIVKLNLKHIENIEKWNRSYQGKRNID